MYRGVIVDPDDGSVQEDETTQRWIEEVRTGLNTMWEIIHEKDGLLVLACLIPNDNRFVIGWLVSS